METLVLASASPRRAAILRQLGLEFEQVVSRITDERTDNADPKDHVLLLSKRKAEDVVRRTSARWVLGADTIVVAKGCLMGKPRDANSAFRMLSTLRGSVHRVFTGLTLIDAESGRAVSQYEETNVWMRRLSDEEIDAYIATGEALGKAGAYAIQGLGATLVERIEGCYYNVVGLPIVRMIAMMHSMGFPFQLKGLVQKEKLSVDSPSMSRGVTGEDVQ
jgi:septum formation protein